MLVFKWQKQKIELNFDAIKTRKKLGNKFGKKFRTQNRLEFGRKEKFVCASVCELREAKSCLRDRRHHAVKSVLTIFRRENQVCFHNIFPFEFCRGDARRVENETKTN